MTENRTLGSPRLLRYILLPAFLILFAVVLLRNAWLCDDAFITFRTVDNFVHGLGLTWNIAERVQSYTHPLWMFLVSLCYLITGEIYYSSIFLSFAVSMTAVTLFAFYLADTTARAMLGLTMLLLSKAFIDYSSSGLENPLTHLLLVLFLIVFLKSDSGNRRLFLLSLIAALSMVNRMDTALLFLPCVVHALISNGKWSGFFQAALGFLPFACWEIISLVYYGFPFPNNAYAKLNTGIPALSLAKAGLFYLVESVNADGVTLFVIVAALLAQIVRIKGKHLAVALGIVLYLVYTVRIGGDFMSGRFLAAPLLCAVVLLVRMQTPSAPRVVYAAMLAALLVLGFRTPHPPLLCGADYGESAAKYISELKGIADEKAQYYPDTGLLVALSGEDVPGGEWVERGRTFRKNGETFVTERIIGMVGFHAGPKLHILDEYALSDPLLSKLRVMNPVKVRIGHYLRQIPPGYIETLRSGQNQIQDPDLAEYYDKLSLLVRGKIFSRERLLTIVNFNIGRYDYLLEPYETKLRNDLIRQYEREQELGNTKGTLF